MTFDFDWFDGNTSLFTKHIRHGGWRNTGDEAPYRFLHTRGAGTLWRETYPIPVEQKLQKYGLPLVQPHHTGYVQGCVCPAVAALN